MDLEHSNSHPEIANGSSPALRDVHDCETVLYILEVNSCNDQPLNFGHCLQGSKGNFVIYIATNFGQFSTGILESLSMPG